MEINRRNFVRQSLAAIGAAAAGAAATKALEPSAEPDDSPKGPDTSEQTQVALTTDGKLIRVSADQAEAVGLPATDPKVRQGDPNRRWIMVIDLGACDGCGKCTEACRAMHFIPPDREWIRVYEMQDNPQSTPYWFPKPCFHCDNPPCTKVCPVDATFKRQDGVVLVDNERCIGCRFCMAACPYSARSFNWSRPQDPPEALAEPYSPEHGFPRRIGTVEKCDFCPELARAGKLPACNTGCPMGAIYFGDENEDAVTNSKGETLRLSKLLRDRAGYRYLEELGTKPRVYYLPPVNRQYPAPNEVPKET